MKWIMLILLSLTLFACDDASTPSGNVSSSSMYASISAIDDGTTTSIITHLRTASNTQYPDIFLENGDALLASSIGSADDINQAELGSFGGAITINENIKPLQRRNLVINDFTQTTYDAPEYATTFLQTNIAGDKYYLSLERELYTSIRDVPITLPTPFSLTSTQSSNINRLDSLTVDWIPSSDG
ncbi:MAG: hypothetical protein OEX12_13170, partial [Gammaproteobacteria bacterium]|nr:hypothetical protein [Gammaproteobacteria bacterium]